MARHIDADEFKDWLLKNSITEEEIWESRCICNWIDAQPTVNQWIPCSERQPDKDGDYLVTIKYHIMDKPICIKSSYANDLYEVDDFDFEDKKGKSGWYYYDSEYGYGEETNVIAWTQLPDPYRGDQP